MAVVVDVHVDFLALGLQKVEELATLARRNPQVVLADHQEEGSDDFAGVKYRRLFVHRLQMILNLNRNNDMLVARKLFHLIIETSWKT